MFTYGYSPFQYYKFTTEQKEVIINNTKIDNRIRQLEPKIEKMKNEIKILESDYEHEIYLAKTATSRNFSASTINEYLNEADRIELKIKDLAKEIDKFEREIRKLTKRKK